MASIRSLLNPLPESHSRGGRPLQTSQSNHARDDRPYHHRAKKQKMPKDVPIFIRGKVRGELRYPPCEDQDAKLAEEHCRFQIHPPMGQIGEFPRHIPYNSEKKSFLEKTGRESFEVFQYTFRVPGEERTWTVMWDYNIGLVRTTHLFKCNDYSKTTPAKMLNANPGLREICHSITGGALAAQGYWMPFEAAKAVAATFCWKIRYALTPLFGRDFPSLCIPPNGAQFGKMIIDPAIVKRATESANYYRELEMQAKRVTDPTRKRILSRRETVEKGGVDDTDNQSEGNNYVSPPTPHNSFTPINTANATRSPQETMKTAAATSRHSDNIPSPQEILESISSVRPAAAEEPEEVDDGDGADSSSSFSSSSDSELLSTPSDIDLASESDLNDENDDSEGEDDDDDEYMDEDDASTITSTASSNVSLSSSPSLSSRDSESECEQTRTPRRTRRQPRTRPQKQTQTQPQTARKTARKKMRAAPSSSSSSSSTTTTTTPLSREVKAAHALLSLHTQQQQTQTSSNSSNSGSAVPADGDGDGRHEHEHRRKRRRRASA